MGSAVSGVSGSGTPIPLLVRPSEQVEPTSVALRLGNVWVWPCKAPRVNLHVWLICAVAKVALNKSTQSVRFFIDATLKIATGLYRTIPPEYGSAVFWDIKDMGRGSCERAKNERSADVSNRSRRKIAITLIDLTPTLITPLIPLHVRHQIARQPRYADASTWA
jgi:hypothetical protein